jgi:hypothetical protein
MKEVKEVKEMKEMKKMKMNSPLSIAHCLTGLKLYIYLPN